MAKQIWKGGTLLAPLPAVLITCKGTDRDGMEAENVFTVAWTGILNTVPPKTYISVRKGRYSYDIIKNSGEFVINVPTAAMSKTVDYCGMYTGAKVNKFEKCELVTEKASEVDAPTISGCPLSLECRVTDVVEMGTHDMFIADILCTGVEESIIDAEGKLRLDKAGLMAFAHGEYYALGKRIGYFGFSAEKKNSKKKAEAKKEARRASSDTVKIRKDIPLDGADADSTEKGMSEVILDDIIKDIETDIKEEVISEKSADVKKGYPRRDTKEKTEKKEYKSERRSYSDKPYRSGDKSYEKKSYGKKDERKSYGKDSDFRKDYKKDFGKDGFKKNDFKKDGFKKDYKKDSKKPYKKEYKK